MLLRYTENEDYSIRVHDLLAHLCLRCHHVSIGQSGIDFQCPLHCDLTVKHCPAHCSFQCEGTRALQ